MRLAPVLRAASGGITRRWFQTGLIVVVLMAATAAAMLGMSLLTNANEAFVNGFTAHHGADIELTVDTARVSDAQLAATRQVPGVTQLAGPYPELTITVRSSAPPGPKGGPGGGPKGPGSGPKGPGSGPKGGPGTGSHVSQIMVTARTSEGGPLDDLTVQQGHWLKGPDQIVMAPYYGTAGTVGSTFTVISAPGTPKLTLVGYGGSTSRFGAAWVLPSEFSALRPPHALVSAEMLYTFRKASTVPQIAADVRALKAALPAGAVTSYDSWLGSAGQTSSEQSVNTPFVLAFALIGVVLAILIVATLVSGAVVASYRRIGVLKSIGFTPLQVAAAYVTQIGAPTLAGAVAGAVIGNLWAGPALNVSAGLFQAGVQHVPVWIDLAVPAGMCALVALAAVIPALRAGRLSTVSAITAGQAPSAGRGYSALRVAARLALPRPVTIGLAAPLTRPARAASILAAILFGATAVILAVGLDSSLITLNAIPGLDGNKVATGPGKGSSQQTLTAAQSRTLVAAIRAQPGTLHYVAEADVGPVINSVRVAGGMPGLNLVAYGGHSAWLGYPVIAGRWSSARDEVNVNTGFLSEMGLRVGDRFTLRVRGRPVRVQVASQVYFPNGPSLFTSFQTLESTTAKVRPTNYFIGLRPGTSPRSYRAALSRSLGPGFGVGIPNAGGGPRGADSSISLVRLLTELIAVLAGLGVLTSMLMLTRERVHDLGVFKALGMTPRQAVAMVFCWVLAPAVAAAAIAIPAAIYLHALTVQAIGTITGTGVPRSAIAIYHPAELLGFAASGLAIAAAGALLPASWAALSRTTTALRAE